jgi:hypothetical protein
MALSWTMASAICSVQRMPERSMRSLMRFLHAPSTGPLAIGQLFSIRRPDQSTQPDRHVQRFHELKRGLDSLEYFCKGTVLKRMMQCGKTACARHSDPDKRHGPYFELTYKASGKTVNVKLAPEAAPLYKAASLQYRRLKLLLTRLEKLSQIILRNQAKKAYRPQR